MTSIRQRIRERRKAALSDPALAAEALLASDQACERAIHGLHGLAKSARIALYSPLPEEIQLKRLERWLRAEQATLYFPRVVKGGALDFVEMGEASPNWVRGSFGIREPAPDLPAADPALLDIVVVPGVAFGHAGERVGMGAGYYDAFLERCPNALRIALAFHYQLFERLEQQPWDRPVHWIFTEAAEIRTPAVDKWLMGRRQQQLR